MPDNQFNKLYQKYLEESMTPEEFRQWRVLFESGEYGEEFDRLLDGTINTNQEQFAGAEADFNLIFERIINKGYDKTNPPAHRIHFLKTSWFRYAAAIIILFGVGAYLYTSQQNKKDVPSSGALTKATKNDILPGKEKAVLTLSDGSIIMLDSAANGQIAVQEGSSIIKKEGNILYDPNQVISKEVMYNTMSTPRGGQYQLTLPDGTHVWLNAASSITYPTAFIEKQRIVKITGEVYFEVKKDMAKPFIVQTYKDEIKVLGTQFNVNAYSDEPAIKTSLMEGSVQIGNKILKPGQSFLNDKIQQTNIEEDIAWKNGAFSFNKTDLVVAMRQFSRWYDVEIIYVKPDPHKQISGQIGRDLHLSEVLEGLKGLGIITRIEGKRLIVDVK